MRREPYSVRGIRRVPCALALVLLVLEHNGIRSARIARPDGRVRIVDMAHPTGVLDRLLERAKRVD